MKTDAQLEEDVRAELLWDRSIAHPAEIAVAAKRGTVTLRGTVGTFHQRRAAVTAAKRVLGTRYVDDKLQVRLMDEWARDDAQIRGAALQALEWNTLVPADRIDVKVENGQVTLTGDVAWLYQKDAAERTVSTLAGVTSVRDEIAVASSSTEVADVSSRIAEAFRRGAQTHAHDIRIEVRDGSVTLEGRVGSWAEHDEAMAAAAAAPGVRNVEDLIAVGD